MGRLPVGEPGVFDALPTAWLRRYVHRYTAFTEPAARAAVRRQVPRTEIVMIFSWGDAFLMSDPRTANGGTVLRSFVAGLHDSYVLVSNTGGSHGIQVDLTPVGARMLLGVPMYEVANRTIGLEEVAGRWSATAVARLAEAPGWSSRFAILDEILAARIRAAGPVDPRVRRAWARLRGSQGRLAIASLAEDVGWSHRHLLARFKEEVGLPPKAVARILRFQRAFDYVRRDSGTPWAEVAQLCGYYDQAHMLREFRGFAGAPPARLALAKPAEIRHG
ncbi:AraC family transcriptional regulator [Nonomuraea rosea]|uniref:AraC family transcriptional regulator n=1 Tax=Nonomuraea rosea TaxID=638574 RepID=A0ABP6XQE0_9ACTN